MANDNRNLSKAKLTSRETDYNEWYLDVAKRAELFEYSPTPGCIYFLPKSAALWETIKAHVNVLIDQKGVRNKGQFTDALLTVKNPDNVAVIVARAF